MADKIHEVVEGLLREHDLETLLWTVAHEVEARRVPPGRHPDADLIRGILPQLSKVADAETMALDLLRTGGVTGEDTPEGEADALTRLSRQAEAAAGKPARNLMHPDPWGFLVDTGLLFEINRTVLHPVGLALQVAGPRPEDPPGGGYTVSGLWDASADPEGIAFDDESLADGARKLTAWMGSTGRARQETRQAALGYIAQPYPGSTDEGIEAVSKATLNLVKSGVRLSASEVTERAGYRAPVDGTANDGAPLADLSTKPWRIGYYTQYASQMDVETLRKALAKGPSDDTVLPDTVRIVTHTWVPGTGDAESGRILHHMDPADLEALNTVLTETYDLPAGGRILQEAARLLWERRDAKPAPADGPQNPTPFQRQLLDEAATVREDIAKLRKTLDTVGWPQPVDGELITEQASAALLKFHGLLPKSPPQPVPGTRLYVPEGWTLAASAPGEVGTIHFRGEMPPPLPEGWKSSFLWDRQASIWAAEPATFGVVSYGGEDLVDMASIPTGFEAADAEVDATLRHYASRFISTEEGAPLPAPPAPLKETRATVGGIEVMVLDPQAGDGNLRFLIGGSAHPQTKALLPLLFGGAPVRIEVEGLPRTGRDYTPCFHAPEYAAWQRQCFTARKRVSLHFTCPKDPVVETTPTPTEDSAAPAQAAKHAGTFAGLPFTFTTCTVKSQCAPPPSLGKVYRIEVELSPDADHAELTRRLREYSGTQAHDLVIDGIIPVGSAMRVRAVIWPGVHYNHRKVTFLEMPEQPPPAPASTSGEEYPPERPAPAVVAVPRDDHARAAPVSIGKAKPYLALDDLQLRVSPSLLLTALIGNHLDSLDEPEAQVRVEALLLDASVEFDALAAPNPAMHYPPDLVKRITCDLALGILARRVPAMGAPRSLDDLRKLLHPASDSRAQTLGEPVRQSPATDLVVAELRSLRKPGETPADTFHRLLDEARQAGAARVASTLDKGLTALLDSAINANPLG